VCSKITLSLTGQIIKMSNIKLEEERFKKMLFYENEARRQGCAVIAGMDEAGRGAWAGPVVAGLVILPEDIFIAGLDDSKKLPEKKREALYEEITDKALHYSVGLCTSSVIDRKNVLKATYMAMKKAVSALKMSPDIILIDGRPVPDMGFSQVSIVRGDSKSASIAAASIIAKVTRDRMMKEFALLYPEYGFEKHKGYGTKLHMKNLAKYGICQIHRKTFKPVKEVLNKKEMSSQQLVFIN